MPATSKWVSQTIRCPPVTPACKADKESVTVASEAYYAKNASYASAIDDAGHSATTLVGAGFLHSAPSATGYTITYTPGTGAVVGSLAGC